MTTSSLSGGSPSPGRSWGPWDIALGILLAAVLPPWLWIGGAVLKLYWQDLLFWSALVYLVGAGGFLLWERFRP